jgi:isocitrate dehydrogenase (NADP) (EC 1.1.1.42)
MAKHTVTYIPGDGIGPEVSAAARRCIEATGVDIKFEEVNAGSDTLEKTGTLLPDSVLDSIRKNKVAIKGPITTPVGSGFRSVNVALRRAHDLYACVRPCKSYAGVRSRYNDIDLVIVRENTEDLYAGIEFEINKPATAELIGTIKNLPRVRSATIPVSALSRFPCSARGGS